MRPISLLPPPFMRVWIILSAAGLWPGLTSGRQQVLTRDWDVLYNKVDGRMFEAVPFARSCFSQSDSGISGKLNTTACSRIKSIYLDEITRSSSPTGFINTQWETCQSTGEQCLLDYQNPRDPGPVSPPNTCSRGSVADYYIDIRKPEDVTAAFQFSRSTKVPLVIKNTGHDYKGRSSSPHSLTLWTHNLKNITFNSNFVPEGCSSQPTPGVSIGAGTQWGEVYAFAESHNITVVGGSDKSVGAVGGWLQGGGHGALSNSMGMGVDRVLEFKIVTPDGKYRTANACQNQDLFFALRGGGGGTFGVVLESTILASPRVTLQAVIVSFKSLNATLTNELFSILIDNGLTWADEGWGGFATAQTVILINPKINGSAASKSMKPLIHFGAQLVNMGVPGAQMLVPEFPSWGSFFRSFTSKHVAEVGNSLALASRLVSRSNFATPATRNDLRNGLVAANDATGSMIILMGPPTSYKGDGGTSINEAWRSSVYHVTVVSAWNWNATIAEKKAHYTQASDAMDHLRKITPDAAYLNEADVYEPNHEVAFWGNHYPELLRIKRKYDPEQLLDCWQCVGWDPKSPRFACYL